MNKPRQAVILCGGLGERLRPLTDTLPKPLAPINGRPFLAFLIEQLRDQGIERIVLLTGYLGSLIRERFTDGSQFGLRIDYSDGPAEWDTGRRLWEARAQLDERFLLLYSDNYVPFSLDKMTRLHEQRGKILTLLLQAKQPGNVRLSADGALERYDRTRSEPGLDYVEIGYMIVERDSVLQAFPPDPNVSFARVLEALANTGRVAGMVSRDPYHSISDVDRWKLAERYLQLKRIVMVDRDGTINQRPPRGEYVADWHGFRWVDETVEALGELSRRGFRFIVVSNQAGIGRGVMSADAVEDINRRMVGELASRGIDVLAVYVCPHHWDDRCTCRKPEPGMFFRASREHLVRLDRTVYVGDDPRDATAAFNAECPCVLVGPERDQDPGDGVRPALTAATMLDAVPWILSRFASWEALL